ncbi:MAG TPA: MBL fold metallo-hydrolase [Steroidobacteraceae bacterium]|nr:MBL fold metallo-hydrolase [Steroidobacteraceae bacterium]
MITNTQAGTNVHEVAEGVFRINTPVPLPDGAAFNFNQYLVVDDAPLLFHTGPRRLFPLVSEAIGRVVPLSSLHYLAFSHYEADECGSLNDFLAAAPQAVPVCSRVAAMVSVNDVADRPAHALADGEELTLGRHVVRWYDTPHLPHAWECGLMFESHTRTLFCGDLFTQGGRGEVPITEGDILGPSEAFRVQMDYYAHCPDTTALLERLAGSAPGVLACMHGSAWRGDGAALLRALARSVSAGRRPD